MNLGPAMTATATLCKTTDNEANFIFLIDIDLKAVVDLEVRLGFKLNLLGMTIELQKTWKQELYSLTKDLYEYTLGPLRLGTKPEGVHLQTCKVDHGFVLQDSERCTSVIQSVCKQFA